VYPPKTWFVLFHITKNYAHNLFQMNLATPIILFASLIHLCLTRGGGPRRRNLRNAAKTQTHSSRQQLHQTPNRRPDRHSLLRLLVATPQRNRSENPSEPAQTHQTCSFVLVTKFENFGSGPEQEQKPATVNERNVRRM
jgi:hypothetical protein